MIESGKQQVLGLDNNCKCLDWCRLCGTDKAIKEVPHSFHVSTPAAKAQTSVLEVSTKIGKVKHHAFALSKLNFIFCFIFGMVWTSRAWVSNNELLHAILLFVSVL